MLVLRTGILSIALACSCGRLLAATFTPLGALNGGLQYSEATDVTPDGQYVVGSIIVPTGEWYAYRWSQNIGMQVIGDLPMGNEFAKAMAVSTDGRVVVGLGSAAVGAFLDGFRWTSDDGFLALGTLAGGNFPFSYGLGVSGDGAIAIGDSRSSFGNEGFRWTAEAGMQGLGDLPGGTFESYARAISRDGRVIVGTSHSGAFREAFRWTEADGMQGLGFLPGIASESSASAVSPDGSVVIGTAGGRGWRWTQEIGKVDLGTPVPHDVRTAVEPLDMTPNGQTIVGNVHNSETGSAAFIWDQLHGVRLLQSVLTEHHGLVIPNWTLIDAHAISDDGRTIAGRGRNPQGREEAWVIQLAVPEPREWNWFLLLAAAVMIRPVSRRRVPK